jgi:hypothetical protein
MNPKLLSRKALNESEGGDLGGGGVRGVETDKGL